MDKDFSEFVKLCYQFVKADDETQRKCLALMSADQASAFLVSVGLFRILTEKEYHDKIKDYTLSICNEYRRISK